MHQPKAVEAKRKIIELIKNNGGKVGPGAAGDIGDIVQLIVEAASGDAVERIKAMYGEPIRK